LAGQEQRADASDHGVTIQSHVILSSKLTGATFESHAEPREARRF
jgi:hypothetical protein